MIRRALLPCLLAWLVAASSSAATELQVARQAFEDANRRFTEAESTAEFLEVAARYQSILDGGVRSGAVLFNQGNAYVRGGALGRAIASYRQAARYRPRDPLLGSNLDLVLARVGTTPPERSVLDHVLFWRRWLSVPEAAWTLVGFSLLAFGFGVAGVFRVRGSRIAARIAAVGALLAGLSYTADVVEFEWTGHGVVTAPETIARKGNAESFAPAFTEPLAEGSEFEVLERTAEWVRVVLPGGLDGWLAAADVTTY